MGRKVQVRPELQHTNILYDNGKEIGHLGIDGILVLDSFAVFMSVVRYCNKATWCPVTTLNQKYGLRGTWGHDQSVMFVIEELIDLGCLAGERNERGVYSVVKPLLSPRRAVTKIPPYSTAHEVFAGLNPIAEDI